MVRIADSHPAGPGSIPGVGELFFEVIFICKSIDFFFKVQSFDLIKWTLSLSVFDL